MTLIVSAAPQSGAFPVLRVLATSTNVAPAAIPENTPIRVNRIHADGTTHRVLTPADPRLIGGTWSWLDAHAPFNQQVRYTVTAVTGPTYTATSSPVWLLSNRTWLVHLRDGSLSVPVDCISDISEQTVSSRAARFELLGAGSVFLSDGKRNGQTGSMTFRITPQQVTAFRALFDEDTVVLVNTPGTSGWDVGWLWIHPGSVSFNNKGNLVRYPYRDVTVQFEGCGDPDVEFEPDWTYSDLPPVFATYNAVAAAYGSYADLVTNTRL